MDHIVYLDHKAKELENLKSGKKTMIIRGAMGRKMPYGRVNPKDVLYFIENKGDGLVEATAIVKEVFNSEKLEFDHSMDYVDKYQNRLLLDERLIKRFGGKRYLVLITVEHVRSLDSFPIDRSDYGNMDDWLPVGNIDAVKV